MSYSLVDCVECHSTFQSNEEEYKTCFRCDNDFCSSCCHEGQYIFLTENNEDDKDEMECRKCMDGGAYVDDDELIYFLLKQSPYKDVNEARKACEPIVRKQIDDRFEEHQRQRKLMRDHFSTSDEEDDDDEDEEE